MTRRALLFNGLALSPLLLLCAWDLRKSRTTTAEGSALAAWRSSQSLPTCIVTPQLTEGPYFVDELLNRSDIRSDPTSGSVKDGAPLRLGFRITQVGGAACAPLAGAAVDVWQCDALGIYSDVRDPGFNTVGQKFLRGSQITDQNGYAEFLTIYPGWYQGRAVHTHFKVRTDPRSATGYQFTSQLFYDDTLTDVVHAQPPYSAKGRRTVRNDRDGIFLGGGDQLVLRLTQEGGGYSTTQDIGVDLSAPSSPDRGGPPPPGVGREHS